MSFTKLYVGNLNYRTTEEKLKELFSQFGDVSSVNILQGRGFGFVEMASPDSANQAKDKLNGTDYDGRKIIVNEAKPRTEKHGDRGDRGDRGGMDRKPFRKF